MSAWQLGIDFGTSYTVAAVARDGTATVVDLESNGSSRLPSSVFLTEDGEVAVGTAALHQAVFAPERFEPTPKRAIGEGEIFLGDRLVPVTELVAALLRRVYTETCRQQGETVPAAVRLTHPADWSDARLGVLRESIERAGIASAELIPEPVAAAARIADATPSGRHVAVYDFGGGTFDAAVLLRTEDGFRVAGPPAGRDPLGGEDIDQRIITHLGTLIGRGRRDVALTAQPRRHQGSARRCGVASRGAASQGDPERGLGLPAVDSRPGPGRPAHPGRAREADRSRHRGDRRHPRDGHQGRFGEPGRPRRHLPRGRLESYPARRRHDLAAPRRQAGGAGQPEVRRGARRLHLRPAASAFLVERDPADDRGFAGKRRHPPARDPQRVARQRRDRPFPFLLVPCRRRAIRDVGGGERRGSRSSSSTGPGRSRRRCDRATSRPQAATRRAWPPRWGHSAPAVRTATRRSPACRRPSSARPEGSNAGSA